MPRSNARAVILHRTGAAVVVAALAVLATAACIGSDSGITETPSPEGTPAAVSTPLVSDREVSEYRSLFDTVTRVALQSTRVLNGLAIAAVNSDDGRRSMESDVTVILGSFELLRQQLAAAEPVPDSARAAHESITRAVAGYIAASRLLLPPESGGADLLTFDAFQEAMQSAGADFHGAGALLP